jgi:hypothetical protein
MTPRAALTRALEALEQRAQETEVRMGIVFDPRPSQHAEQDREAIETIREFLQDITTATKHGPGGFGGRGTCAPSCIKCIVEHVLADTIPTTKAVTP